MSNFKIKIKSPFSGFCPAFWKSSFPTYGNRNQASSMKNVIMLRPDCFGQGPGLVDLTNGTQAGKVTTLIKGILDMAQASNLTFAVGGNLLYELSADTVSSKASAPVLPHVIDKATVTGETGEDVKYYKGEIFYTYNHSGSKGDCGKYDLTRDADADFDDDWLSQVGLVELMEAPHQIVVAGTDGIMAIANKYYVTTWDGTTATEDAFNTKDTDSVIPSIVWNNNRFHIAANKPNLTGDNKNISSIYIWDGNDVSWENRAEVKGRLGALYVKDGVTFVFHEDITTDGGYRLGYLSGTQIIDVASYKGSLPEYYQVTEYENHIVWISDGLVNAWGSTDIGLPAFLSQLADGGHTTVGGFACPFGTPMIASNITTSYRLANFSGHTVDSDWKGITFPISGDDRKGLIEKVIVDIKKPSAGAKVDITLRDSKGIATWTDSIAFDTDGAITKKIFKPMVKAEDIRLELDWANSSSTNSLSIKSVIIKGKTLE